MDLATPGDEAEWLAKAAGMDASALRAVGRGEEPEFRQLLKWNATQLWVRSEAMEFDIGCSVSVLRQVHDVEEGQARRAIDALLEHGFPTDSQRLVDAAVAVCRMAFGQLAA